jgi:hypothetical protein
MRPSKQRQRRQKQREQKEISFFKFQIQMQTSEISESNASRKLAIWLSTKSFI